MTKQEAMDYINAYNWSQWRLGLERTAELLRRLGNPQDELKFVHVAGSNGKGSTCAMLERILREAGYRTGFFPSPYIEDFRERIQICGEYISEEALCEITEIVKKEADAIEDHPSQFELVTAIGLLFFCRQKCDIVVLEVGLGGKFDATNVIRAPEVAVITHIGLEHTEYLGSTLAQIAHTKGGIIKSGSDVVLYENDPEVMEVIGKICQERNCPLHIARFDRIELLKSSLEGQYFAWNAENCERSSSWEAGADLARPSADLARPAAGTGLAQSSAGLARPAAGAGLAWPAAGTDLARPAADLARPAAGTGQPMKLRLSLLGEYQLHNAATALTTIEVLRTRGFTISEEAVAAGLAKVQWPARFEVLCREPLFILDGGHNPQCAEALAESIESYLPDCRGKLIFLMGVLADKNYEQIISTLAPFAGEFVCVTPDSERALPAQKLAEILQQKGFTATACSSVEEGVGLSLQKAATPGSMTPVLAFGSLYMAGRIRSSFPHLCKIQQRKLATAARRALTQQERDAKSSAISAHLIALLEEAKYKKVKTILSYRGTWEEANVDAFNIWAESQGYRMAYPISLSNGIMKAAVPAGAALPVGTDLPAGAALPAGTDLPAGAALPVGAAASNASGESGAAVPVALTESNSWHRAAYDILEPVMETSQILEPHEIDLIIVPCVAFDPKGNRCGHGAGYYDRFLVQMAQDSLIMVAFEAQKIETLATEKTDLPILTIVTEVGVRRLC